MVQEARPGAKGTIQITANGDVDLGHSRAGLAWRIADLHADIAARGLQLAGQPLGDAHLTAESQAAVLRAHLESDFAGSAIRGDGQWRLEGDYPGTATITFSRLDFARLRAMAFAPIHVARQLAGSAEGELRFEGPGSANRCPEGPAANPQIRNRRRTPAPANGSPVPASLTLQNSGPIVATHGQLRRHRRQRPPGGPRPPISAHRQRPRWSRRTRSTCASNGRLDLAIVQDFNHDFVSSGTVTAEATVRGSFSARRSTAACSSRTPRSASSTCPTASPTPTA